MNQYGRGGKTIVVVNVGGNNAKAEDKPDNFVSTLDGYSFEMEKLLDLLKDKCSTVIAVGSGYYDESKTNPKNNPLTGGKSYFSNKRSQAFQNRFKSLCDKRNISFINIDVTDNEWLNKYIYNDGLHANQSGHEMIADKLLTEIENLL